MRIKKNLLRIVISVLVMVSAYLFTPLQSTSAALIEHDGEFYQSVYEEYESAEDGGDPLELQQETDEEVIWIEKVFSFLIALIGIVVSTIMEILGIDIDAVVFGRIGRGADAINMFNFELCNGNVYGFVSAKVYAALRSIVQAMFLVLLFVEIVKQAMKSPTAQTYAEFKQFLVSITMNFVMLFAAPGVLDAVLIFRDLILRWIGSMVFNGSAFGLIETTKAAYDAVPNIMNSVMYAAASLASLYYMGIYISVAMTLSVAFMAFPVVCLLSVKNKQLMSGWISTVGSCVATPIVDAVLMSIPIFISTQSGIKPEILRLVIVLICTVMIIPVRGVVSGLLGLSNNGGDMLKNQYRQMKDKMGDIKDKQSKRKEKMAGLESSAKGDLGKAAMYNELAGGGTIKNPDAGSIGNKAMQVGKTAFPELLDPGNPKNATKELTAAAVIGTGGVGAGASAVAEGAGAAVEGASAVAEGAGAAAEMGTEAIGKTGDIAGMAKDGIDNAGGFVNPEDVAGIETNDGYGGLRDERISNLEHLDQVNTNMDAIGNNIDEINADTAQKQLDKQAELDSIAAEKASLQDRNSILKDENANIALEEQQIRNSGGKEDDGRLDELMQRRLENNKAIEGNNRRIQDLNDQEKNVSNKYDSAIGQNNQKVKELNSELNSLRNEAKQAQQKERTYSRMQGQSAAAGSADYNMQQRQNDIRAKYATVDNFEDPEFANVLSYEQKAQFYQQRAQQTQKELKREKRMARASNVGMAMGALGSVYGGSDGVMIGAEMGQFIGETSVSVGSKVSDTKEAIANSAVVQDAKVVYQQGKEAAGGGVKGVVNGAAQVVKTAGAGAGESMRQTFTNANGNVTLGSVVAPVVQNVKVTASNHKTSSVVGTVAAVGAGTVAPVAGVAAAGAVAGTVANVAGSGAKVNLNSVANQVRVSQGQATHDIAGRVNQHSPQARVATTTTIVHQAPASSGSSNIVMNGTSNPVNVLSQPKYQNITPVNVASNVIGTDMQKDLGLSGIQAQMIQAQVAEAVQKNLISQVSTNEQVISELTNVIEQVQSQMEELSKRND